jgi:hypothetical protein
MSNESTVSDAARHAEVAAGERVLSAAHRIRVLLEALPVLPSGQIAALVGGYAYWLVQEAKGAQMWSAADSDTYGLDFDNMRTLMSMSDVKDWCLSAEELSEIAVQMEAWHVSPEYRLMTSEEQQASIASVEDLDAFSARSQLEKAVRQHPDSGTAFRGELQRIYDKVAAYDKVLNDREVAPTGSHYNELFAIATRELSTCIKNLEGFAPDTAVPLTHTPD